MKKKFVLTGIIVLMLIFLGIIVLVFFFVNQDKQTSLPIEPFSEKITTIPSPAPALTLVRPSISKILKNDYHVFQTFNNCGPAALSMALSYYGINVSQKNLGGELRPYQIKSGKNDDKSVTLEELAGKAKEYKLIPYFRPSGNLEKIKLFITYDLPVMVRTWTKVNEDIGHFRVIKGYDNLTGELIQDDSLQGKNLRFSYSDFNTLWEKFNYEYLVLVPEKKKTIVETILGEDLGLVRAWQKAKENSQTVLNRNPDSVYDRFNLSVALYNIGDYEGSVKEFEKVEDRLSARTLWYQIEPIQAYFKLGNYKRVFAITDKVLGSGNRAFSELYLIRGEIYKIQGDIELAKSEFEKAVFYNINLKSAHEALSSL